MTENQRPPLNLGEIIRRRRELAELPMRQLATMVGISGPYLSQIERGLRAPSERVLHAIADSLRTTADALVEQATPEAPPAVLAAIAQDPNLTARQRQALVEVYTALTETTIARRRRGDRRADGDRPGG
ncbi:helix-turn-helix transcriptional regulator [Actinoplanes sp. NPDC049316]|uniref:helix-turn-helix domain-containing protein n=1 Tax=Actinoplanes sp. NPDC049316 TaxID=3154727 RepID=UPI00343CFF92